MADITVVGGINIDIEGSPFGKLKYHDSNPGRVHLAFGGVGRNITENVARLGGDVAMVSVVGDDRMGQEAKNELWELIKNKEIIYHQTLNSHSFSVPDGDNTNDNEQRTG